VDTPQGRMLYTLEALFEEQEDRRGEEVFESGTRPVCHFSCEACQTDERMSAWNLKDDDALRSELYMDEYIGTSFLTQRQ